MYGDLKVKNWHFSLPDPDLMPSLGVILFEFPDDITSPETRMMELSEGEDLKVP